MSAEKEKTHEKERIDLLINLANSGNNLLHVSDTIRLMSAEKEETHEKERIDLLINLANSGNNLLHVSDTIRRKVDAVRRLHGNVEKELEKKFNDAQYYVDEIGKLDSSNPNLKRLQENLETAKKQLRAYRKDSPAICAWLRDKDKHLYDVAATKEKKSGNSLCCCEAGKRFSAIDKADDEWIESLSIKKRTRRV